MTNYSGILQSTIRNAAKDQMRKNTSIAIAAANSGQWATAGIAAARAATIALNLNNKQLRTIPEQEN